MRLQIGFTGTKQGMTAYQREFLRNKLLNLKINGYQYVHHGDCVGADAQFHEIAISIGFQVIIHPPTNPKLRAHLFDVFTQILPAKDYLSRNRDIVDACSILLATPKESFEVLRSGTWATVRYARSKKKEVFIIRPEQL